MATYRPGAGNEAGRKANRAQQEAEWLGRLRDSRTAAGNPTPPRIIPPDRYSGPKPEMSQWGSDFQNRIANKPEVPGYLNKLGVDSRMFSMFDNLAAGQSWNPMEAIGGPIEWKSGGVSTGRTHDPAAMWAAVQGDPNLSKGFEAYMNRQGGGMGNFRPPGSPAPQATAQTMQAGAPGGGGFQGLAGRMQSGGQGYNPQAGLGQGVGNFRAQLGGGAGMPQGVPQGGDPMASLMSRMSGQMPQFQGATQSGGNPQFQNLMAKMQGGAPNANQLSYTQQARPDPSMGASNPYNGPTSPLLTGDDNPLQDWAESGSQQLQNAWTGFGNVNNAMRNISRAIDPNSRVNQVRAQRGMAPVYQDPRSTAQTFANQLGQAGMGINDIYTNRMNPFMAGRGQDFGMGFTDTQGQVPAGAAERFQSAFGFNPGAGMGPLSRGASADPNTWQALGNVFRGPGAALAGQAQQMGGGNTQYAGGSPNFNSAGSSISMPTGGGGQATPYPHYSPDGSNYFDNSQARRQAAEARRMARQTR